MFQFRVLIAEDSKAQLKALEKRLSSLFHLTLVGNGKEVISKLKSDEKFGALILDLRMPGMNGFEVLKSLRAQNIRIKTALMTSQLRQAVEAEAIELGIDYFMAKPLNYEALINLLNRWQDEASQVVNTEPETDISGGKLPFSALTKCCFICGYENVKMFLPIEAGYEEDWSNGLFPLFKPMNGFVPWDLLRNFIAVCPYCFFASSEVDDFSSDRETPFPYLSDSKRILSRTISTRKRLVGDAKEIDWRFDDPARNLEIVLQSLRLAEKCMNGLILGEKVGAHGLLGYYNLLIGSLDSTVQDRHYKNAAENFGNQLKQVTAPPEHLLRSNFFLIALNMAQGKTDVAKKFMRQVVDIYAEKKATEVNDAEKTWLTRISLIWNKGLPQEMPRTIE